MQHKESERNTFIPISELLNECAAICTNSAHTLNVHATSLDEPLQQGISKIVHYQTALARVLAIAANREVFEKTKTYLQYTLDAIPPDNPKSTQEALEHLIAANNLVEQELLSQQEKATQESVADLFRDLVASVDQHNRLISNVVVSFEDV